MKYSRFVIGLASELLGNKYNLPAPQDPTTNLSRHEAGLFSEAKDKIADLGKNENHRSQAFNRHLLPRCRPLVEAIGHRMAYEAAKDSGVRSELLDLFQWLCISADLSWYVENCLVTREGALNSVAEAYSRAFPILLDEINSTAADDYITAPIVSEMSWEKFVDGLPSYGNPSDKSDGYQSKL